MILKIIRMILRRTVMGIAWFSVFCTFFGVVRIIYLNFLSGYININLPGWLLLISPYSYTILAVIAFVGSFSGNLPGCRLQASMVRNPTVAGMLSFFTPGLGQAYNGTRGKGYLFLLSYFPIAILYVILLYLFKERLPTEYTTFNLYSKPNLVMIISAIIVWLWSINDASGTAKKINEGQSQALGGVFSSILKFSVIGTLLNISSAIIFTVLIIAPPMNQYFQKVIPNSRPQYLKNMPVMQKPASAKAKSPTAAAKKTVMPREDRVEGISYSKDDPVAVIGRSIYHVNDDILTGKIIDITPGQVTVKFAGSQKKYKVGDAVKE